MLPVFALLFSLHSGGDSLSQKAVNDSVPIRSLSEWINHGSMHGRIRNYSMATINKGALSDHFTSAIGGYFKYHTARLKGFELGLSALFTFRMLGPKPDSRDSIAGSYPVYELQLYDVLDPFNTSDLDRIDELYVSWKRKGLHAQLGRFEVRTPHVNPMENSRMKPYSFQGVWLEWSPDSAGVKMQAGWLNAISPRSTVEWISIGEAIGLYNGETQQQIGDTISRKIHSAGMGILSVECNRRRHRLALWNYFLDNVSNSIYGRYVHQMPFKNGQLEIGAEWMGQNRLSRLGPPITEKAYFDHDNFKQLLGAKVSLHFNERWRYRLAYVYSDDKGKLLFPREFGREHFFATIPRGRVEGLADAHIITAGAMFKAKKHWTIRADVSQGILPNPDDNARNKYKNGDYLQFNADVHYAFTNFLKGLDLRFLYVTKMNVQTLPNLSYYYYRADMHHFNLVLDLHF